uniref:Putative c2h2-type zn-finger protein n=1 Tax=Lutzomyia longipalpis TaxID=7200 RepID=A0A1B0CEV1_LUTLO
LPSKSIRDNISNQSKITIIKTNKKNQRRTKLGRRMCRILIYGCPKVVKQIRTAGAETIISCSDVNPGNDLKTEKFDAEIVISHAQIADFHKFVFIQATKDEEWPEVNVKDEEPDVKEEINEPYEEFVEAIEPFPVKDESNSVRSFGSHSPAQSSEEDSATEEEDDATKKKKRKSAEYAFKCTKCGKALKSQRTYRNHMHMHRQRKYICELCSKGFLSFDKLKRHMATHTGEKAFQCSKCPRTFGSRYHLQEHFRIHTNEKPFKCHICGKAFRSKTGLNPHLRSHMGIKSYVCEICGKAVTTMACLREHKGRHENVKFGCTMCKKKFSSVAARDRHFITHTGEKKHKCNICDKAFARGDHAKKHMALHIKYGRDRI